MRLSFDITKGYKIIDLGYTTPCWIWQKALVGKGYGKLWINRKCVLAHRYSYELVKGKIPIGLILDHLCKLPACINPEHLEAVTYAINKQRDSRTILNPQLVEQIRIEISRGEAERIIALRYNVTPSTIYSIRINKQWKI